MTLEELLNKLIEKGWEPFGRNYYKYKNWCLYIVHTEDGVWSEWRYWVSLRELVSKESGLWQFVCENGLYEKKEKCRFTYEDEFEKINYHQRLSYQYRLIESALTDESELEQFLLDNIKIEWK